MKSKSDMLKTFLDRENNKVKKGIDDDGSVWQTYEPTLARHLSASTIRYYDRVIHSELITDQIKTINTLLKALIGIFSFGWKLVSSEGFSI